MIIKSVVFALHVGIDSDADLGSPAVNLSFTGLVGGTWYLGQTVYNDGTNDIGTAIVNVK